MATKFAQPFFSSANGWPVQYDLFGLLPVKKTMTFAGGTVNDPGDFDGTGNPATLFTVTGNAIVSVIGVCTTDLAGASATVEIGTSKSTANLIAQTTGTNIDANEIWHDATPDNNVELITVAPERFLVNSANIIQTVATANVTSGVIIYYCWWRPISDGASVVAA